MGFTAFNPSYRLAIATVVLALGIASAAAADPPGLHQGVLDGIAYLISVPPEWNGGLVMFAHGYEGEAPGRGSAQVSPLASQLARRGYAWAASGYRSKGYRPDFFLLDVLALRAHVIERGLELRQSFLGQSYPVP